MAVFYWKLFTSAGLFWGLGEEFFSRRDVKADDVRVALCNVTAACYKQS